MPPRNIDVHGPTADDQRAENEVEPVVTAIDKMPPMRIVWRNIIWMGVLHLAALYGLCLMPWAGWRMWLWTLVMYVTSAFGITAGAHRLWGHRAYRARLPLRILLAIFNCMASQNDIIEWARDHRVHHKYSETHADPHNAKRGFFFAHIGWLLVRKHPDVKEKGKSLDISDLLADPVCAIQRKVYGPASLFLCFAMPALVPWYFWGDSLWTGYFTAGILRYILLLHATWCVNSAAHMWGGRPYDRHINPRENLLVALTTVGEGHHNYHHVFPQDYSASEFAGLFSLNVTTLFIDVMGVLGLAYNRKKMTAEAVARRKQRTGEESR